jgi:hypothetical protein
MGEDVAEALKSMSMSMMKRVRRDNGVNPPRKQRPNGGRAPIHAVSGRISDRGRTRAARVEHSGDFLAAEPPFARSAGQDRVVPRLVYNKDPLLYTAVK